MGGSTEWEDQLRNQKNIVSTDERNPFHDWNHVYMRYCSGDTWVGTNTEESGPGRFGLWFSGHYQVEAALTYVRDTWGIGSEEGGQFMLAGGSAGGIGTNNNCNFVQSFFGDNVETRCSPQAGLFFPQNTEAEWLKRFHFPEGMSMNRIGALYISKLFDSYLDPGCVEYAKAKGDHIEYCWEASYLLPHIKPKILVAQNFWDKNQIDNILCWESHIPLIGCSHKYMREFKNHTVTQLTNLATKTMKGQLAVFAPSCYTHTENLCLFAKDRQPTTVNGMTYLDTMKEWLTNPAEQPVVIDQCKGKKSDRKPCNPTDCWFCPEPKKKHKKKHHKKKKKHD